MFDYTFRLPPRYASAHVMMRPNQSSPICQTASYIDYQVKGLEVETLCCKKSTDILIRLTWYQCIAVRTRPSKCTLFSIVASIPILARQA